MVVPVVSPSPDPVSIALNIISLSYTAYALYNSASDIWKTRDAIRKAMANVDAEMSAFRGAAEWADTVAYIGNTYRAIAEKMVNARKRLLAASVFAAERASLMAQKLAALRSALEQFVGKASPVIDQLKKEIEADELLMAQEQERAVLGETVIQPLWTGYDAWVAADPRVVITAFGAAPDFPVNAEEMQFYISFYPVLSAGKDYIKRLRTLSAQFFSDYQTQAMVPVTMYPDKPPEYQNPGHSYQPTPLSVSYPEFVELSPQGIVTRDVSYTGDPAGLDALVSANVALLEKTAEYARAIWDEEVFTNYAKIMMGRMGKEQIAALSGQADKLDAIKRFEYLEQFVFTQAVPDDIKEKVLSFYVYERDGVSMANIDTALAELAAFPATQGARWSAIAAQQCGDGTVYEAGANEYAIDGNALFTRVDGFMDGLVKVLNERAAALSADARIGDIISGVAIYRNPAATKLVNADGSAPGGNQNAGILAAIAAFMLIQGV